MRRPVLPAGRKLPWILGAVSLALLAYGLVVGNDTLVLIGGLGAAATFVGFILPRLILKTPAADEDTMEPPPGPP